MFDLYKNNTTDGVTTYVRPFQLTSYNPLGAVPSISVQEEKVYVLPTAQTLNIPCSNFQASFTDPSVSFNLVDPTSGTVTGTMTFAQLHVAMYSLYLTLAAERDAGTLT